MEYRNEVRWDVVVWGMTRAGIVIPTNRGQGDAIDVIGTLSVC